MLRKLFLAAGAGASMAAGAARGRGAEGSMATGAGGARVGRAAATCGLAENEDIQSGLPTRCRWEKALGFGVVHASILLSPAEGM